MASTKPTDQYPLGNARHANCRLNLQYSLLLKQFNNDQLSPRIVTAFPRGLQTPNLRIADLCCGTGLWLIDLQYLVSESAELYGFDLNIDNLPHRAWIPEMKLHQQNIFEPFPTNLHGTFDIISLTFALTFVTDANIDSTISNILTLLKPNGWLQWTETDFMTSRAFAPTPASRTKYMDQLIPGTWELLGLPYAGWVSKLESIFKSHQDVEPASVSCLRPEPDLALLRAWTEVWFMAPDEMLATYAHSNGHTEVGRQKLEKYKEIIEGAQTEFREDGTGFWGNQVRVIGRKRA